MIIPRILVVGAGHMGSLHAQKVAELEKSGIARLAAIADVDEERALTIVPGHPCPRVPDFRNVLSEADAAIVAVPTLAHFEIVSACLIAGLDVLVEKPIAATLAEGEKLLSLASEQARLLQVGHLEWFNAAMATMAERVTRPRFIECHRMGPFTARATDVDIVRDLMIHDIDIVQRLLGEEPERIESIGVPLLTEQVDLANARLNFGSGCIGNFTASRVSPTPMRKIRFFQKDGYFSVDFLDQAVVIARRILDPESGEKRIDVERLEIDRADALLQQLQSFVESLKERKLAAGTAKDALGALRTAVRVIDAMPDLEEIE